MDDAINLITVPAIVAGVYTLITLLKQATSNNEKVLRLLPIIATLLGAVLGIVAYYADTGIMGGNVFVAIFIGGSSGLAATGTNQIFKQMTKDKQPLPKAEGAESPKEE